MLCIGNNLNDLLTAIDEVLALLGSCIPRPEYIARFESCKERIIENSADRETLQELYVLSAPRGFLGDGPLYPRPESGITQNEINKIRWNLVERIHKAIDDMIA